jgi:hypothetical protein
VRERKERERKRESVRKEGPTENSRGER